MPSARYSTPSWMGIPKILAGFMAAIDTLWGAIAVLPFDWTLPKDTALGLSLVLGLPAYLLDLCIRGRAVIFLPAVILLRAFTEFFLAGSPATLGRPWTDNVVAVAYFVLFPPNCLLIAAAVLLQWSKLRNPQATHIH